MPVSYNELEFAVIKGLKNEVSGQLKAVTGLVKMLKGYRC